MTKVLQNGLMTRSMNFLFHRRNFKQKNTATCSERKLRLENLEDRMLLAVLPVTGSADAKALISQGFCDSEMNIVSSNIRVTTYSDKIDQTDGLVSLREAINYLESQGTVLFGQAGTITLSQSLGQIVINKNITFDATSTGTITLDAAWTGRIMSVIPPQGKVDVSIKNFRFTQGQGSLGGALWIGNNATVSLSACLLENNSSTEGGAVYLYGTGKLLAYQTVWKNNQASRGGAICVGTSGKIDLDACTFSGNSATEAGGALYVNNTTSTDQAVYITNSLFEANNLTATTTSTTMGGGACMITSGKVTFDGCDFLDNSSAVRDGGAICTSASSPDVYVFNSYLSGNIANRGGAVFLSASTYSQFDGVTFENNTATWAGGGIYNEGSCDLENVSVNTNIVKDNGDDGGGIYNQGYMILAGSVVWGNACLDEEGSGAGIMNSVNGNMFIYDTLISDNVTGSRGLGGGIRNMSQGSINMVNTTVANNSAYEGGGIENSGTISLVSSIVTNNQASGSDGGGIYLEKESSVTITSSTVYGNAAARNGGGICTLGTISLTTSTVTANQDSNWNAQTSGLYEGLSTTDPDYHEPVYDDKAATLYGNITTDVPQDESVSLVLCDAQGNVLQGAIDFAVLASDSVPYSETFQILNNGTNVVTLNTPECTGLNLANFSYLFSSLTVEPGKTIALTITFSPEAQGVSAMDLNFKANGKSQLDAKFVGTVAQNLGIVSQKTPYLSALGGTTTYSVVLNEAPGSDVVVELMVPNGLMCNKTFLTFTTENWSTPQSVQLTTDEDYLSTHQVSSLSIVHRIIPTFATVFASDFDPTLSLFTQKLANVDVSIAPYISVQEGTSVDIPPGYEKLDAQVPASITTTSRGIASYDEFLILNIKVSNPSHKTVSNWTISWGDNTCQTVSHLSNSIKFSHWYSQSGSYNIDIYIEYADGTAENAWHTIATHTTSVASSLAVQAEPLVQSSGMAAAVDSVLETEETSALSGDEVSGEDIAMLSNAAVANTLDTAETCSARSVYFSQLRLDSFFDGNLSLRKKRILS